MVKKTISRERADSKNKSGSTPQKDWYPPAQPSAYKDFNVAHVCTIEATHETIDRINTVNAIQKVYHCKGFLLSAHNCVQLSGGAK